MNDDLSFANFLKESIIQIDNKNLKSGLISICTEIPYIESFSNYGNMLMKYSFSALWEEENNISFMVLDKCKYINLDGPKRFKMAKDFHDQTFKSLINIDQSLHPSSLGKIIYFFSYSDNFDINGNSKNVPNLEAILPKILIISDGRKSWIRMNAQFNNKKTLREVLEEFWIIREETISIKF